MADPAQAFRCIGQTKFDDLKHWQRVVIFISGVTASVTGGKTYTKAQLAAETFHHFPKCAKNVHEMSGLTKEQLAIDHYDMTFPSKYTLADLSHGITKDNCYRKYLELQTEVKKFIPIWNSKLVGNPPMIPSGKNRATVLFEVLQDIWDNNEKARVLSNKKDLVKEDEEQKKAITDGNVFEKTKRRKDFTTAVPYSDQTKNSITWMPHEFLVFMLCGPPANEKCHAFFRLGGRLNTDGSFSEDVTKKQKLKNSRLDSRNSITEDRKVNDREEMKMDLVALQRAQVSDAYICFTVKSLIICNQLLCRSSVGFKKFIRSSVTKTGKIWNW